MAFYAPTFRVRSMRPRYSSRPDVQRQPTGADRSRRPHHRIVAAEPGVHGRGEQPELKNHDDQDEDQHAVDDGRSLLAAERPIRGRAHRPLLDADRVDVASANVEDDPGQRPARRTGRWRAGPEIEASLVTRTVEAAFAGPGYHGAGQVRALLAERDELARRQSDQQTGFVFVRIGEHHGAAHREVVDRRDRAASPAAPLRLRHQF